MIDPVRLVSAAITQEFFRLVCKQQKRRKTAVTFKNQVAGVAYGLS
jgi:hypothetical protein